MTLKITPQTIKCPAKWSRSECLVAITRTLRELVQKHQPTVCAIEGLFYAQNAKTALIMGEARGAAMAAVAEGGLEIFEIAPPRSRIRPQDYFYISLKCKGSLKY